MAHIYYMSDYVILPTFILTEMFELGNTMSLIDGERRSRSWRRIQTESSLWNIPVWTSKYCKYGMEESRMLAGWVGSLGTKPALLSFFLESNHLQPGSRAPCNPFPLACSSGRIWVPHVSLGTAHQMLNLVKSNCYRKVYEQDGKNHTTHHRVQLLWTLPVSDLCNATDLKMVLSLFAHPEHWSPPVPGPSIVPDAFNYFLLLAIQLNFQAEELKTRF